MLGYVDMYSKASDIPESNLGGLMEYSLKACLSVMQTKTDRIWTES